MFNTIKKTIKNSAIYGAGTLSSKLIGFVLLPLYTTYLSTTEYGILAVVEITATLLAAVVSLKINAAFFRWYWDKNFISKQKSIFFTSLVVLVITSSFLFFPVIYYDKVISELLFQTQGFSYLIVLMLLSTMLQVIIQLVLYLIQLKEKAVFYSLSSIIKLFVALIFTVIFITQYGRGINGIYEALIISQVVFLFFTLKFVISNIKIKFEWEIMTEMLKFSLPLIFAEISGILLNVSDRYMLNFMSTASDVGIYSLGFKVSNTIRVFIYSSVMMAVSPLIYQFIDKPNNKRFYTKIMTYFALGSMAFVLSFSIFSKEIVEFLAKNKDFWNASEVIPILSFSIFFGILKDSSLTGLNITKKSKIIAIVVLFTSVLNIILNYLFIPIWGTKGAAIATLISSFISFVVFYQFAQKHYPIPYEVKKVMLVISSGIFLFYLSSLLDNLSFELKILLKSMLVILFPVILFVFNFFEEIEILSIKRGFGDFLRLFKRKGK
jgi:O-antigen/teichoic acid export membrane protein